MEEDDRYYPPSEWEARIEAAYLRMKQGLPPVPWLPRATNPIALRRMIRRMRSGKIRPRDPNISAQAWADTLEQGLVLNQLEIRQMRQEIEEEDKREAALQQNTLEYNRLWMDSYRILKGMPEASDPNSEIAVQLQVMKHELRRLRGRRRSKRRETSGPEGVRE